MKKAERDRARFRGGKAGNSMKIEERLVERGKREKAPTNNSLENLLTLKCCLFKSGCKYVEKEVRKFFPFPFRKVKVERLE